MADSVLLSINYIISLNNRKKRNVSRETLYFII